MSCTVCRSTAGAHQKEPKSVHADTIMNEAAGCSGTYCKAGSDYALRLVMNTHPHLDDSPEVTRRLVRYGSSPRGAQAIIQTARVRALMEDRYNVSFEDVRSVCHPSLRHRVFLNYQAVSEGKSSDDVINEIIQATEE